MKTAFVRHVATYTIYFSLYFLHAVEYSHRTENTVHFCENRLRGIRDIVSEIELINVGFLGDRKIRETKVGMYNEPVRINRKNTGGRRQTERTERK